MKETNRFSFFVKKKFIFDLPHITQFTINQFQVNGHTRYDVLHREHVPGKQNLSKFKLEGVHSSLTPEELTEWLAGWLSEMSYRIATEEERIWLLMEQLPIGETECNRFLTKNDIVTIRYSVHCSDGPADLYFINTEDRVSHDGEVFISKRENTHGALSTSEYNNWLTNALFNASYVASSPEEKAWLTENNQKEQTLS